MTLCMQLAGIILVDRSDCAVLLEYVLQLLRWTARRTTLDNSSAVGRTPVSEADKSPLSAPLLS